MNVALISRSGLLEFKNSRALSRDHLYFRIMYAARAHVALLYPLTEWTKTDSVASRASSMNSKIALAASSLGSSNIYTSLNFKTYLVVLVKPKKGQVGNPNLLPVVRYLLASTIYNMGNFIRHYKLKVLEKLRKINLQLRLAHLLWKVRPLF